MRAKPLTVGIDDPTWQEESVTPRSTGSSRRRLLLGVAIAVIVVGGYSLIATYLSRQDYGTFAFWGVPNRIDYCGRRYYGGGTVRGSSSEFTGQVDASAQPRWQTVGRTFALRPIQAPVLGHRGLSSVCAMKLYVSLGGRRFSSYSLSGGP